MSAWWCAFCATRCATDLLPALNNHRCCLCGSLPSHCCLFRCVGFPNIHSARLPRSSILGIHRPGNATVCSMASSFMHPPDLMHPGYTEYIFRTSGFGTPRGPTPLVTCLAKGSTVRLCLADDKSVEGSGGSSAQLVSADHVRYAGRPEPSGRRATRS